MYLLKYKYTLVLAFIVNRIILKSSIICYSTIKSGRPACSIQS